MTLPIGLLQMLQQRRTQGEQGGILAIPRSPGTTVPRPGPIDLSQNARVRGERTERPGGPGAGGSQQEFLMDETLLALARSAAQANQLESRGFKDQILDAIIGKTTPQRIKTEDTRRADLLGRLRALRERF